MIQYAPEKRFKVEDLAKQFFLIKDVKTFHPLQLQKTKKDLAHIIILNSKDEKRSNINKFPF